MAAPQTPGTPNHANGTSSGEELAALFDQVNPGADEPSGGAPTETPAETPTGTEKAEAKPAENPPAKARVAKAAPKAKAGEQPAEGDEETPAEPGPDEATVRATELAAFRETAKKLGFEVDDKRVTTKDRWGIREEQRRARERIMAEDAQARQAREAELGESREVITWASGMADAARNGDLDSVAQALGHKDWNAFQDDQIKRAADPNYQELHALKQREREREAASARARAAAEQQEAQRREEAAVHAYFNEIASDAAASGDPVAREFADDLTFQRMVYQRQIHPAYFDRSTGTTITVEQALDAPFGPRGTPTLREQLRALYTRASKAFPVAPQAQESAQAVSHPAATTPERHGKPKPSLPTSTPRVPAKPEKSESLEDLINKHKGSLFD